MIVMFIGGLWHGAAWTFVVWGVIHGACLVIERVLRAVFKDATWTQHARRSVLLGVGTYAAVCFAWVFFRATDFRDRLPLVQAMAGMLPRGDAILATREILQVAVVTAGLLGAHWLLRNTTMEAVVAKTPAGDRRHVDRHDLWHHFNSRKRQCIHLLPILISCELFRTCPGAACFSPWRSSRPPRPCAWEYSRPRLRLSLRRSTTRPICGRRREATVNPIRSC